MHLLPFQAHNDPGSAARLGAQQHRSSPACPRSLLPSQFASSALQCHQAYVPEFCRPAPAPTHCASTLVNSSSSSCALPLTRQHAQARERSAHQDPRRRSQWPSWHFSTPQHRQSTCSAASGPWAGCWPRQVASSCSCGAPAVPAAAPTQQPADTRSKPSETAGYGAPAGLKAVPPRAAT